jgi:hypothetical protein
LRLSGDTEGPGDVEDMMREFEDRDDDDKPDRLWLAFERFIMPGLQWVIMLVCLAFVGRFLWLLWMGQ